MAKRRVIRIEEDKCTGCGECVNACVGGALALLDGKAKLVREDYCDGLGMCLPQCPANALHVEEREAPAYRGPQAHPQPVAHAHGGGCPGGMQRTFARRPAAAVAADAPSALGQWPIQLHLVRPDAPQFQGADVLVAASCTAFACGAFHPRLLVGKALVIACPKLDNLEGYREKLADLFLLAKPRSVTVARMEVRCCQGLTRLVLTARDNAAEYAEITTEIREAVIGVEGRITEERELAGAVAHA